MKKLAAILCLSFGVLLAGSWSSVQASDLPSCPEDQNQRFHNCFAAYITADGDKYVGEWRDDKLHGQGTATFADEGKYVGEFRYSKFNGQGIYTAVCGPHVWVRRLADCLDPVHGVWSNRFFENKSFTG